MAKPLGKRPEGVLTAFKATPGGPVDPTLLSAPAYRCAVCPVCWSGSISPGHLIPTFHFPKEESQCRAEVLPCHCLHGNLTWVRLGSLGRVAPSRCGTRLQRKLHYVDGDVCWLQEVLGLVPLGDTALLISGGSRTQSPVGASWSSLKDWRTRLQSSLSPWAILHFTVSWRGSCPGRELIYLPQGSTPC